MQHIITLIFPPYEAQFHCELIRKPWGAYVMRINLVLTNARKSCLWGNSSRATRNKKKRSFEEYNAIIPCDGLVAVVFVFVFDGMKKKKPKIDIVRHQTGAFPAVFQIPTLFQVCDINCHSFH